MGETEALGLPPFGLSDAEGRAEPDPVIDRLGVTDLLANRLKRRGTLAQLWNDISTPKYCAFYELLDLTIFRPGIAG